MRRGEGGGRKEGERAMYLQGGTFSTPSFATSNNRVKDQVGSGEVVESLVGMREQLGLSAWFQQHDADFQLGRKTLLKKFDPTQLLNRAIRIFDLWGPTVTFGLS
jgi:hypothetical protein